MQKTEPQSSSSPSAIETAQLTHYIESHLSDAKGRNLSKRTIDERRYYLNKLTWFLMQREYTLCDTNAIRHFLAHLIDGHTTPKGRWGDGRSTEPLRPVSLRSYFVQCKLFFNWLVEEGELEVSPMSRLRPPKANPYQISPFTDEHLTKLAARDA
jgi:site-specific recombinase XerD